MDEADRSEGGDIEAISLLGEQQDERVVEMVKAAGTEVEDVLKRSNDVGLDNGPGILIEPARKPIWPRRLVRREGFDRGPDLLGRDVGVEPTKILGGDAKLGKVQPIFSAGGRT